jgi:hypothetical protein
LLSVPSTRKPLFRLCVEDDVGEKMKVKSLVELLSKLDQEKEVICFNGEFNNSVTEVNVVKCVRNGFGEYDEDDSGEDCYMMC